MKTVIIKGIGVICAAGNDIGEVWNRFESKGAAVLKDGCMNYTSVLPTAKRRKMNRYSDMSVYTSHKALEDAGVDPKTIPPEKKGTIFTTGYGPMVSNIAFGRSVVEGDADLCSPTVFANTVSNACVGQVCMAFDCKGVSTVLMGSNNIGYSQLLLSKGTANCILTGSVEEYCPELYEAFKRNPYSKDIEIREGAVTFLLKQEDEEDIQDSYCRIIDFFECSLSKYPLVNAIDEVEVKKQIIKTLSGFLSNYEDEIDVIFSSNNGSYFDRIEKEVFDEVFKGSKPIIDNVKEFVGETLGSAINMNVMAAALILRNGRIPKGLNVQRSTQIGTVLVTGYDVTGNFTGFILKK